MKFNKIVCVDKTKLKDSAVKELQKYSDEKITNYKDYPETDAEILQRIGDAEVVFVSWHTQLHEKIIDQCPKLKYIGMCCSLYDDDSANVAVKYAEKKGIVVKGIKDYGDPGVIEFIVAQLVNLLNGYCGKQWKEVPLELTNRKLGIIGLGTTGKLLAECLLPFGMDLYYYSRTRKPDYEARGVTYLPLMQLLEKVEMISIHLPKNNTVLHKEEFLKFGTGKILINTSLGLPFEEKAFGEWIKDSSNYAIFDGDGKKELKGETEGLSNVVTVEESAGWSAETHERLSQKVLQNFFEYLEGEKKP